MGAFHIPLSRAGATALNHVLHVRQPLPKPLYRFLRIVLLSTLLALNGSS